ncbi:MAG: LPS-assembly protein LptD [Acidobacteriaceae bacterium]
MAERIGGCGRAKATASAIWNDGDQRRRQNVMNARAASQLSTGKRSPAPWPGNAFACWLNIVLASAPVMKACISLTIMLLLLCHPKLWAQTLTKQLPAAATTAGFAQLPDAPTVPIAEPVPAPPTGVPVTILADEQTKQGNVYTLNGSVAITYKDYVIHADHITYNTETGDVTADGNLLLEGGPDDEHIAASHGEMNLDKQTGKLYDVIGTIGVMGSGRSKIYTNPNPFTITGKELLKLGPEHYEIYGGTMTSCRLPHPHWRLYAPKLIVNNGQAKGYHSSFHLLGKPILYLPYVTHPVNIASRQSGFLIPIFGTSSTNGVILGEQYYWVINRSMDATVGMEYYVNRGPAENGAFRYRGHGKDFITARFASLQDYGGYGPTHINQGGDDIVFSGRHDYAQHTRAVGELEYLSSYLYREAFTENFNQALSSEVKSTAFLTHQQYGVSSAVSATRYQNFESTNKGDEIRIIHLPTLSFDANEHRLWKTPLVWSLSGSAAGLRRTEPGFQTFGVVERVDVYPRLSLPMQDGGWVFRPEIGLRETFYSRSQESPASTQSNVPVERNASINRKIAEAGFEVRTPVLERVFNSPATEARFGREFKHTLEGDAVYSYVRGVRKFNNILRFDPTDIVSDTNEVEYGLTQRLYTKSLKTHPCKSDEVPAVPGSTQCGDTMREWLSWRVAQKYFMEPNFGGALLSGRRNVLDTTLNFSGVAFLTNPRDLSPVISRLRVRTTDMTDLEWDLDYDTKEGRLAASNVFADVHKGNYFAGISHARLNAPGESTVQGQASQISDFNQLRLLVGFGAPTRRGLSLAANTGLDLKQGSLQYGAVQTSYNWDCCGLSIEYRKFQLGSVRNEGVYRFSFTLAGIGTAGNLRRAERLF